MKAAAARRSARPALRALAPGAMAPQSLLGPELLPRCASPAALPPQRFGITGVVSETGIEAPLIDPAGRLPLSPPVTRQRHLVGDRSHVLALVPTALDPHDVAATGLQRSTKPVQPQLELWRARRSNIKFLPNWEGILHGSSPSTPCDNRPLPSRRYPTLAYNIIAGDCAREAISDVSGLSQVSSFCAFAPIERKEPNEAKCDSALHPSTILERSILRLYSPPDVVARRSSLDGRRSMAVARRARLMARGGQCLTTSP
jgi:hypothetical protein